MGSKRKLSKKIIDYILANNPKTLYFYDLFGGGGAISFEALKRPKLKEVHYNELNAGVVRLLEKIRDDGVTDEFYQWIDRDTFHKFKHYESWRAGLSTTCWSFGNDQNSYLYGKHIEDDKELLHNIIVNNSSQALENFNDKYDLDIGLCSCKELNKRRTNIIKQIKQSWECENKPKIIRDAFNYQILDNLTRISSLIEVSKQDLKNLNISNESYDEIRITTPIDETIIYLDPPYKDTAKYQKNIDFDKLYEYIRNSPYKIYISGYDMPFEVVEEFEHRSTLSATANNKVIEKLFCNIEEIYLDRLL